MTSFSEQELRQIIGGGESDRVEFKEELSGNAANGIREAICAFANDRRLEEQLAAHNRITGGHLERRTHSHPMEAVHQITRNAVMHRAYEATNAPVHVYWFNDRIEVTNPGGPYGVVTRERFGEPGQVDYRNPNLAEALKPWYSFSASALPSALPGSCYRRRAIPNRNSKRRATL